ncbi:hypothetical protein ACTQX2_00675 [Megamonas funiformis]|jgi:hypothetical protein|uniref:hypothetical protein n=1 Tax=Megamonas funiformis TaxID=437897 RepID=UPI003F9AF213
MINMIIKIKYKYPETYVKDFQVEFINEDNNTSHSQISIKSTDIHGDELLEDLLAYCEEKENLQRMSLIAMKEVLLSEVNSLQIYSKRTKKIKIEQLINMSCLIEKMLKTANSINTPDYLQRLWRKQLDNRKEI